MSWESSAEYYRFINEAVRDRLGGFHSAPMERDFYRARLRERHGLTVLVPDEADRDAIHEVIYAELVKGVVRDESRARYREVIAGLVERGAEALILGCTEIDLLIGEAESPVAVYDTTRLYAEAAVDLALAEGA